jgi:hypothetical protein
VKRHAPATQRNRDPIAQVLAQELPASGTVLEIASGTGEHAVAFAARFPHLHWQPSDPDGEARRSIAAWREDGGLANLQEPLSLDAAQPDWPIDRADAIVCINMVHISPWRATIGLFRGARQILPDDAPLLLYGPYIETDRPTAPSNVAFDADLKRRDPVWGLRKLADMDDLASDHGFVRSARRSMPANNLMLTYRPV